MKTAKHPSIRLASLQFSSTGLVNEGSSPLHQCAAFIDSVLRGIGQVMLQNNSLTGLLFIAGIFYNSLLAGAAVLLGTVVSTLSAQLLGIPRAHIREGLYGFNGALTAIALLLFLQPTPQAWLYVILASACSSVLMAAMVQFLSPWKIPALTAPFVFTTLLFILAGVYFGQLQTSSALPSAAFAQEGFAESAITAAHLLEGVLVGIAQVFFQENVITGALFLAGLFVSARMAGIAALIGSLIGLITAWTLGAQETTLHAGIFGFNAVLTALVFGAGRYRLNATSVFYAGLATLVSSIACAALMTLFKPFGLPAMTLPFVIVTWIFLLASPLFRGLKEA